MNFKELPASETNDFKVGDFARAYTQQTTHEGMVMFAEADMVQFENMHWVAHFKQCRKLEPAEPREWFLVVNQQGEVQNYARIWKQEAALANRGMGQRNVRVREVLEPEDCR